MTLCKGNHAMHLMEGDFTLLRLKAEIDDYVGGGVALSKYKIVVASLLAQRGCRGMGAEKSFSSNDSSPP